MTGSEGMKHTQRMLASGTAIVGGVNPRKAGEQVAFPDDVTIPVFGSVADAMARITSYNVCYTKLLRACAGCASCPRSLSFPGR